MNLTDRKLAEILRGSANRYLLIRVGSSTSSSKLVVPDDLDYICILADESRSRHEKQLAAMIEGFVNVGGVVGFTPNWPECDQSIPGAMLESLRNHAIDFHFGPVTSGSERDAKHLIHFAGPISLGDYELFRNAFPVLAYIFETYHKCLLGDASVICSHTRKPSIEQFAKLTLLNCERFKLATNTRVSSMAVKKILLLRFIWQNAADPYRSSRLELKKVIGSESSLVGYAMADSQRLLESPLGVEKLLDG